MLKVQVLQLKFSLDGGGGVWHIFITDLLLSNITILPMSISGGKFWRNLKCLFPIAEGEKGLHHAVSDIFSRARIKAFGLKLLLAG